MRKALLSCLVPMLLFSVAVEALFLSYRDSLQKGIIRYEVQSISTELAAELYSKDINYVTIRSYQSSAAKALKEYNLTSDKEKIAEWLEVIERSTDCISSVVCDSEGSGYDERGKTINLSQKEFFNLISTGYGAESSGAIYIYDDNYGGNAIAFINGIKFKGGSKGYLISFLNIENLSEGLFEKQPVLDYGVWVAIKGHILAEYGQRPRGNEQNIDYVWDVLPDNINKDRLEHALMQSTRYDSEVDGYGYVVAVPAPISGGTVICLMSYEKMERAIAPAMHSYHMMFIWIIVLSIILMFILFVGHMLAYNSRKLGKYHLEKDSLTGLLTKESIDIEVNAYLSDPGDKHGLLFLMGIDGVKKIRREKGDAYVDSRIVQLSKSLQDKFRVSDVIGRIGDDQFIVFMKDISEPKDVRKQIDEFVVLIHDIKNSDEGKSIGISINVGGAIAPKDGNKFSKLYAAASSALADSRSRGTGLVAFYQK